MAWPALARKMKRGWFDRGVAIGPTTTYLGAVKGEHDDIVNGVMFPVSEEELATFDEREVGYTRVQIEPHDIRMLGGPSKPPEDGPIWYYAVRKLKYAKPEYPIVQSYVDVCMTGCLEVESKFPLAKKVGFAKLFVTSSSDWSKWWVNDRIYPRRPFVFVPEAYTIDRILAEVLGKKRIASIPIEPARWEK